MTDKNVKLRKLKKSDLPYFLKWWKDKQLIKLTSGITEKDDSKLKSWFSDMLNSTKENHYMILFGKKVVGHIFLANRKAKTCELNIVIGEKDYWGKGIGTIAIKKILNIGFKKLGYSKCYLEVRPENKRAIEAYEFCGFKKSGFKKYPNNKFKPITLKMTLVKNKRG